jgi:hypothetical protein
MIDLSRFANQDLRAARREGYILIGQTKVGTVELAFREGAYILKTTGLASKVLAQGKPAVVRPTLCGLYSVVEA